MKKFIERNFYIYVKENYQSPTSYHEDVYTKKFHWHKVVVYLLLLLIVILLGTSLASCSSKETEPTEPEVTTDSYYYQDGKGNGYLIDAQNKPKKITLHDSLSTEENLEIIQAAGNRVESFNQGAFMSFQFNGFDKIIQHRDYVGILAGNRVMVPVYNEYQHSRFALELIFTAIIFFFLWLYAIYYIKKDVRLIWKNLDDEYYGSTSCFLSQFFLVVLIIWLTILSLINIEVIHSQAIEEITYYSAGLSTLLTIVFAIGSLIVNFKSIIAFVLLTVIFVGFYFVGLPEQIVFYSVLIPSYLGLMTGLLLRIRKKFQRIKN